MEAVKIVIQVVYQGLGFAAIAITAFAYFGLTICSWSRLFGEDKYHFSFPWAIVCLTTNAIIFVVIGLWAYGII